MFKQLVPAVVLLPFVASALPVGAQSSLPAYNAKPQTVDKSYWEDFRKGDSFEAVYFPSVKASSSLYSSTATRYTPKMLQDGDRRTAWVEGADGDGVNSWIEFTFDRTPKADPAQARRDVAVTALTVMNGYQKNSGVWEANGRVREFTMLVNGTPRARLRLVDTEQPQIVPLPRITLPRGTKTTIRLVIARVYRGRDYADTGVSEIEFGGEGVF